MGPPICGFWRRGKSSTWAKIKSEFNSIQLDTMTSWQSTKLVHSDCQHASQLQHTMCAYKRWEITCVLLVHAAASQRGRFYCPLRIDDADYSSLGHNYFNFDWKNNVVICSDEKTFKLNKDGREILWRKGGER